MKEQVQIAFINHIPSHFYSLIMLHQLVFTCREIPSFCQHACTTNLKAGSVFSQEHFSRVYAFQDVVQRMVYPSL